MSHQQTRDELVARIKVLSERLWEGHCRQPDIDEWLANFDGTLLSDPDGEHLHALHLLARVSYFGLREIRVLLRSMYRDHFRYQLLQQIRSDLGGIRDLEAIDSAFSAELSATRFLGMGNPAESGTHLLYYFRHENRLPKDLFVSAYSLLSSGVTDPSAVIIPTHLKRLVFIDDLCGSGVQSVDYSRTVLKDLREVSAREGRDLEIQYLVLFGTTDGIAQARTHSDFDLVSAVSEIDETYKTYGADSRLFWSSPDGIDKNKSEALAHGYGTELWARWPLGFDDGQLLFAFHHNTPDNSLPILWYDESPTWRPAFRRSHKVY